MGTFGQTVLSMVESEHQDRLPGFHPEKPDYYFADFVELQIKSPSNDFTESFQLDVMATIGEYNLSVELSESALERIFRLIK